MQSRILSRYILKEVSLYFLVTLLLFTGILLTVRMLKLASLIINKGVALSQIATVFISIIPSFLEIALPLATLLGVMLAFARLSGDSELVVIRASGVSLLSLATPIALFGGIICVLGLLNSLWLRPLANTVLEETLFAIASSKTTSGLTQGVFNKFGALTLYAEQIDYSTGALKRVLIDDRRNPSARQVIVARDGSLLTDESERTIILELGTGAIHEKVGQKYVLTNFVTNSLSFEPNELQGKDEKERGKKSRELSLAELSDEITNATVERIELSGAVANSELANKKNSPLASLSQKIRRLEIEATRRFSMPYAAFALSLLAMALGVQPPRAQRTWGASLSATLGLLVFVLYYATLSIAVTLSESGAMPAYLGLWIPNAICAVIGAVLLVNIGLERWHSIAQGFEHGVIWLSQRAFLRRFVT